MVKLSVIQKAIQEAKKSDVVRGKVGAVLFTPSGNIIASAHNVILFGYSKVWTRHAERFLLDKAYKLNAYKRFGKLCMLVVRYRPGTDTLANAKPCPECHNHLAPTGIRVFYTNKNGNIEELA